MSSKMISADISTPVIRFDEITNFLDDRRRHIFKTAFRQLLSDSNIDGVMIGGSIARGSSDRESDLDLIVTLTSDDVSETQIQRMIAWAKKEQDFYEYSIAGSLPFFGDLLTLFFHGLSINIDMGFLGPSRLANTELESYGIILLDRSCLLHKYIKQNNIPRLSRNYEEELWINLWKVRKTLARGNYWRTSEHLTRARRAVAGLILKQQSIPIHYRGREDHQIERLIDVSIFHDTWPSDHRPDSYVNAALALIGITQTLDLTSRTRKLMSILKKEINAFT